MSGNHPGVAVSDMEARVQRIEDLLIALATAAEAEKWSGSPEYLSLEDYRDIHEIIRRMRDDLLRERQVRQRMREEADDMETAVRRHMPELLERFGKVKADEGDAAR